MMWALLWKFRKYIGIGIVLLSLVGLTCSAIKKHDSSVAAEAVQAYKVKALDDEVITINNVIAQYDSIVDSLHKEFANREQKKAAILEHAKGLAKVQVVEQSEIDSFVAAVRDSAVKVVVDSVDLKYRSLIINMGEQVASATAIAEMAQSDIKNRDEIITERESEIRGLQRINEDLLQTLNTPSKNPPIKHGIGHFIIHKAAPVVFLTYGVARTIHEFKQK